VSPGPGAVAGGGCIDELAAADVLVVGAGAAGLTAALGCAAGASRTSCDGISPDGANAFPGSPRRVVVVLTKTRIIAGGAGAAGGASAWAQGGVASAVGEDDDPALHAADTMAAGAGLNDARIVDLLTREGPRRIGSLLALGARFDRGPGGGLALGREAAHSRRRILHARGDATGAEVVRTLVGAVRQEPSIRIVDEAFALDLVRVDGVVVGLVARHGDGRLVLYRAGAVVLATGGLGQLFLHTTNPREATADGLAMAARAGARLVDLEFVQFHPTALAVPDAGEALSGAPLPLLTEALRGEGAVLVDEQGRRFMAAVHPEGELAPRDVVARAIWSRLRDGHRIHLDARRAIGESFPERFPTVFALCRRHGIDPRAEPMPVVPAAHYHMGGVAVDASGRTSLPGLWACGEVAATGAHGANRLASNSLLEALVFGARVAEDVCGAAGAERGRGARDGSEWRDDAGARKVRRAAASWARRHAEALADLEMPAGAAAALIARVRRLMWERVGVERDEAGLAAAVAELEELSRCFEAAPAGGGQQAPLPGGELASLASEARNLLWAGRLLAQAALARRESRGGHYRVDLPLPDAAWQRRLFLTATAGGEVRFESREAPTDRGAGADKSAAPAPVPATAPPGDAWEPAPLPVEQLLAERLPTAFLPLERLG
jgi:L-aspartate oxidase